MLKFGEQKSPVYWIAAADFADMVSQSFRMTAAENKILYVYGPERWTLHEGLETYCEIVNPDLHISKMPIWFMKTVAAVSRKAEMKDVANLMSYYENIREDSDPSETYKLFGIPPTKPDHWCTNQNQWARAAM